MKKKLFLTAVISACFLTGICASAQGLDSIVSESIPNDENSKRAIISGTVTPNTDVTLRVYKVGKSQSDLSGSPLKDVLYYGTQLKSGNDGSFSIGITVRGDEGSYPVEINYKGATVNDKLSDIFVFLPDTKVNEFLGYLNDRHILPDEEIQEEKLSEFAAKINEYYANKYITMPDIFTQMSPEEKNEIYALMMYDDDYNEIPDVSKAFNDAYIFSRLPGATDNEAVDTLLKEDSEFIENIGIADSEALTVYLDERFIFDRSEACAALTGSGVVNGKTAKDAFENKVVTLAVGAQTKYTIIDILKALNSYLSLDFTKYDNSSEKMESFSAYLSERMPLEPTITEIKYWFADAVTNVLDKIETSSPGENSRPNSSVSSDRNTSSVVIPITKFDEGTVPVLSNAERTAAFTDLDEASWAKDDIIYLYENGYIDGMSETEFAPTLNVTREQFLKMLINAAKITVSDSATEFGDVVKGTWYEKYVATAVDEGIVNGIGNMQFGIGRNITREDMAVMMWRVLKDKVNVPDVNADKFTDDADISEYAKEAIDAMQKLGILNGMDDGSFAPKSNATRAQAAKCMRSFIELTKEG